ncbi:MAG: M20 family metallopeptidase [Burkholderiales bacterium]|jgi:acetylornithine deacetylase/succinyl-diaminopimelate desuccinylase-like protein
MSHATAENIDTGQLEEFVSLKWDDDIVPRLVEYIRIPCKSPHFDPEWAANGYIDQAVELAEQWSQSQAIAGLKIEVIRLEGRTPVLFFEIEGDAPGNILMYGHLDKQPEMSGWRDGFGPWIPVLHEGKLYGRGGADDGYAIFASLLALSALKEQGVKHARIVGLIETCEESGSYDLPAYLEALKPRIGNVDLVIGLDSGCGNYEQLWVTTSLRGIAAGTLSVEVLNEGVHSGDASGVVPSSFRVARLLLDRIEESASGHILPEEFHCEIPAERSAQAQLAGKTLGESMLTRFPFAGNTRPMTDNYGEAVLNRTWRPFLSVVGADGMPAIKDAGNVLRPGTSLKLSLRIPPLVEGQRATEDLKRILEADPPHGAKVSFEADQAATGWHAPPTAAWLKKLVDSASRQFYGKPAMLMGEGGTIPFMAMLGESFPQAQFLITGVLGPKSNAHGPNEFLHIAYAKKLTACVAQVIAGHAARV